jgi:hypothetical protein
MEILCKPEPPELLRSMETGTMTCEEFVENHQAGCAERLSFLYLLFVTDKNNSVCPMHEL